MFEWIRDALGLTPDEEPDDSLVVIMSDDVRELKDAGLSLIEIAELRHAMVDDWEQED